MRAPVSSRFAASHFKAVFTMQTIQDLRYVGRMLRRQPVFSLVALLTLAPGIGANTAIFSVIDSVLLRPLPYPHAERLMVMWHFESGKEAKDDVSVISWPKSELFLEQ